MNGKKRKKMEIFRLVLIFLLKFLSGIAFVIAAFICFMWILNGDRDIAALLSIAFSDLYFGRFAK